MSNWGACLTLARCANPADDEEDDEPVKTAAPSTAPKKSKYADEDAAEEEVKVGHSTSVQLSSHCLRTTGRTRTRRRPHLSSRRDRPRQCAPRVSRSRRLQSGRRQSECARRTLLLA